MGITLFVVVVGTVFAAARPLPSLRPLVLSLLQAGVPVALMVARRDVGHAMPGTEEHLDDPYAALELLQAHGTDWEVSRDPLVQIAQRSRPREVDAALSVTVRIDGDTRPQSLRQFLDAVVSQAPGIAWVMAWDAAMPRETLALGVVCSDGSMTLLGVYPSR